MSFQNLVPEEYPEPEKSRLEQALLLVGTLDWCSRPTLKRVNPVLVVLSRVVLTVNVFQAILPDGAA